MTPVDLLIAEYCRHLQGLGRSSYTLKNARSALVKFSRFLASVDVDRPEKIDRELIADYQQALAYSTGKYGRPLTLRTQAQVLSVLKGFTRFLHSRHCLVSDPSASVELPKKPKGLPRVILSSEEIRMILQAPDKGTDSGYRDRVILELLYDTAIRRAELSSIQISQLDLEGGYIHIIGKGSKHRVVPVCGRVCGMVEVYIRQVRPRFLKSRDSGFLILNRFGNRMNPNGIWAVVKRHAAGAGIKKNVSTHTFRHTCATHMMKNGAPVRHIQELLGHESLETTQLYTRVTINDL